jgi:hypothetical protein
MKSLVKIDRGPWLPPVVLLSDSDPSDSLITAVPGPAPVSSPEPPSSAPTSNLESLTSSTLESRMSKSDELTHTESHRYAKPLGEGVDIPSASVPASSPEPPASSIEPPIARTCEYVTARGHRCRMLLARNHSSLCSHHARQARRRGQPDDEALAAELLASVEDFTTAASVNLFLGNVVKQLARKRIQRLDAIAHAYLSQLLLNSLSVMEKEMLNQRPLLW